MKKSLLFIIPLSLTIASCTNTGSLENSEPSEVSSIDEVFEVNLSETLKYYFGDAFVFENIGYYAHLYDSSPKVTVSENYVPVMEQLDKCVFHIREDDKSYLTGDEITIHVTVHNDIDTYYLTLTCGIEVSTIRFTYGENRDIRTDLISFSGEQYYTETKEMFESLYARK